VANITLLMDLFPGSTYTFTYYSNTHTSNNTNTYTRTHVHTADPACDWYQDPSVSGLSPDSECSVDQAVQILNELKATGGGVEQRRVDRDVMTLEDVAHQAALTAQGNNPNMNPNPDFSRAEQRVLQALLLSCAYDPKGSLKKILLNSPTPTHDALRALLPKSRAPGGSVSILPDLDIERMTLDWNLCVFGSALQYASDRLCFTQSGKCKLMATPEQQLGISSDDTAFVVGGQVFTVPRAELHAKPQKVFEKWVVKLGVDGLYRAADEQLRRAWVTAGLPPCPRDGYMESMATGGHVAAGAPMDLSMPYVPLQGRANVPVQDAIILNAASAQESVAVATECPVCEVPLRQGASHVEDCVVDFAVHYKGPDKEIKKLGKQLRAKQRASGYSIGVWAAMRWSVLLPDEAIVSDIDALIRAKRRRK
jgi:hypothetical protein